MSFLKRGSNRVLANADATNITKRLEMERLHSPFYLQRTLVSLKYEELSRLEIFTEYCKSGRVLHIGCTQYPITNVDNSLHIALSDTCKVIDGYDIDKTGYATLAPHVQNGKFLGTLAEAGEYDVVLIPEVLEHVGNVHDFLTAMAKIKSTRFIITVPDLFQCMDRHFQAERDGEVSLVAEGVHPDHNYWFTPYTLTSVIKKYTDWTIEGLFWINNISLMAVCLPANEPSPNELGDVCAF